MKSAVVALLIVAAGASASACGQADQTADPSSAGSAQVAPANEVDAASPGQAQEMEEIQQQELAAQRARAAADPVAGVIERAEICIHFGGEEPFDDARRAQIDQAFEDNRCDTVVADGDALKARRPQDAARIEAAIADLGP
ncbi:hypothetical protein [Brevundimonas subvibrioides]|uniref:Lipoprotein n=1 Tax=Brevundimonas subvibrioides (strain ATCC 15264 / DSM 4735 / LMG 14903 / NBRC 16000 / CB 81) TaxID=633149 RepID=D9QF43_BRESC|nr:hypothetical protein [Brevundimonas subvibrioides]ADL00528.1 conserved hypothetical protein [Brevundimonas subvibrioides ATCC 15264]